MKINKYFKASFGLLLSTFLILSSCNTMEKKIVGFYTIDEFYFKNETLMYAMGANIIGFAKTGECNLPIIIEDGELYTKVDRGEWTLNSVDTTITIISKHTVINGTYKVSFEKDYQEKLLKLVFENEEFYLKATKGMQNFDQKEKDW